jgi:DNA-binding CsgD family transcriptional regulator
MSYPRAVGRLSEREHQVLYWISHGMTNPQIGKQIYVSEDTVKTHCRRMFKKLGAKDRAHAVRRGFELGLLQHQPFPAITRKQGPGEALQAALVALGWTPPPKVMSPERAS